MRFSKTQGKHREARAIRNPRTRRKAVGKFVMFVGDEGAVLLYVENGEVKRRLFSAEPEAKSSETFVDLLNEYPTSPLQILVDLVDQSYLKHTLPPVTTLGVNKIVQRRLNRDFPEEDLKGSLSLGREKTGRKDWNFLLIALPYAGKLERWCKLIYELPNRLVGIYLLPVESGNIMQLISKALASKAAAAEKKVTDGGAARQSLAEKLQLPSVSLQKANKEVAERVEDISWQILVAHNRTGGFRQIVLKNGKLVFTRMAQALANEKPMVLAGNIEQEVKNTIEYLRRLSYNEKSPLEIVLILGEDIKANLNTDLFRNRKIHCLTPYEASELLDINNSVLSGDRYCDILLSCAFLCSKNPILKLMPPAAKKLESLYTLHAGLKIAGVMAGLALISGFAMNIYDGLLTSSSLIDIQDERDQISKRVDEFEDKASTFEVDPFRLDTLIKIYDKFLLYQYNFIPLAETIAQHITPSMRVTKFEWQLIPAPKEQSASGFGGYGGDSNQSGKEEEKKVARAKVDFELSIPAQSKKETLEQLERAYASIEQQLPGYDIVRTTESGAEGTEDELQISFNDQGKKDANLNQVQKSLITITFTQKAETPGTAPDGRTQ